MSRKTEVRIDFAGERRTFDLSPVGCIRRLQDACDAGAAFVLNRLIDGSWRYDDLREPIIQGLVGGGLPQREAQGLVEKWLDPEPKQQFIPVAQAVILAWLAGAEEEDLGESMGEAEVSSHSPEESSASPTSTDGEPS